MQLLQEEFFGKIFNFINEIRIFPIRVLTKLVFYLVVTGILVFIFWMVYTQRYLWIIIFIGLIFLGEVAHFIRKSREKVMNERIEIQNELDDEAKSPLNKKGLVMKKANKKKIVKNNLIKKNIIKKFLVNDKKIKKSSKKKVILIPTKETVLNESGLLSKK